MKNNKIKAVFILPSLRAGGAERVLSYISQNLDSTKFSTSLLVAGYEKDAVFKIDDDIEVKYFNKKRTLNAFFPIFKYLLINKPKIVLSAISNLNMLMGIQAFFFSKVKFIGREVSVDSVLNTIEKPKRFVPNFLYHIAYKQLDKIICQSNDMAKDIQNKFKFKADKLVIINNPISEKFTLKEKLVNQKTKRFITVGTLTKRKGHIRLLEVLSKYPKPFNYTIVGNGVDRDGIFAHAKNLGLTDYIEHIPFTDDVARYLKENDVFLQGSYVEGFPNALLESCAVGTPVIAFKAPGGIDEIIENGINGFIADNEEDYLAKLQLITEREWVPEIVRDSVMKKYSRDIIIKQYEDLFLSLVRN